MIISRISPLKLRQNKKTLFLRHLQRRCNWRWRRKQFTDNRVENRCRGGLFHHDLTPKKSALTMKKLFDEDWHTEEELVSDERGIAEFRGFYGKCSVEAGIREKTILRNASFMRDKRDLCLTDE